jgi:hypothetical protein
MRFIIELTCDRDHKTVLKEIRMSALTASVLIKPAFALALDAGSPVEGFRILDEDEIVHATAWTGPR